MVAEALLKLALQAQADPSAAPVLADLVLESGWYDDRVMALCIGVPLDDDPPIHLRTPQARTAWKAKRLRSWTHAVEQWSLYIGSGRADVARAILSVLLFGEWLPARQRRDDCRSPWLLCWRNATSERRAWRAEYRRLRRDARLVPPEPVVMSVAQRYGAGT